MSYVDQLIERCCNESPEFKAAYDEEVRLAAEEKERRIALMKAIADFRKVAKISQQQMAQSLGVSQARVSQLEKGAETLSVDYLLEMLHLLGGKLAVLSSDEVKKHGLESKVIGPKSLDLVNEPKKPATKGATRIQPTATQLSVSEASVPYQQKRSRKPRS